ncbi:hypothetical protein SKAU_G00166260 [Synaphobranchus kaupii]|uniref:Uncharacterized protein n=1 Tax=Synaphobranchus kaupii TaxID=118154 RepID=A0A9Q1FJM2_SYNKA|nr:hypothetical protein SKAU_G00166260 [Synaphobranchus kaupii]
MSTVAIDSCVFESEADLISLNDHSASRFHTCYMLKYASGFSDGNSGFSTMRDDDISHLQIALSNRS